MPLCPQITNTPVVLPREVTITAVSYTSTTATYSASGHTFVVGSVVVITGLLPAGYNGTFTVTSISGSSTFTVANTTNAALTDQSGLATPGGDYVASSVVPVVAATTTQVNEAQADADAAAAAAAAASAAAAAASASAATAYAAAIAANTAASTAQATANGKNKVTYSTAAPGSTANTTGDIWYQYGTASPNVGRIIAQYMGAGGTSWTQTTVSGLVIANIDAGSITTGTLSVGLGITTGTGTFTVNAVTGAMFASSANITGTINSSSGTIGGFSIGASSIFSSTNLVIETSGQITGGNSSTIFYGFANIGGGAATGERLIVAGTSALNGNTGVLGNLSVTNSATFGAVTQQFEFLSSTGNVRVASTYGNAVSGRSMQISSSGLYGTTASTRRKKHEITSYTIDSAALLNLDVKTFKYKPEIDAAQDVQYGFIAEEAQELGLDELIQYDSTGVPDYFAYEKLPIFLLQLIKELKAEINQLKGA
jgi:hypothetical protein